MKVLKIMLFYLCFSFGGDAQELDYKQYTTDDGLPSMTVYEIVQDSSGLLWMGTANGLVSFDGEEFKIFSDPRLKDNEILEVEISKDGHITFANGSHQYVRLEGDLVVVVETEFEGYFNLSSSTYADLLILSNRPNSKVIVYDSSFQTIYSDSFLSWKFSPNEDTLVILKEEGDEFAHQEFTLQTKPIKLLEKELKTVIPLSRTRVGLYESENQYFVIRNGEQIKVDSFVVANFFNNGPKGLNSFAHLILSKSEAFIAWRNGLFFLNDSNSGVNFLPGIEVNFLFKDNEESIWASTTNDGLYNLGVSYSSIKKVEYPSSILDAIVHGNYLIVLIRNKIFCYNLNLNYLSSSNIDTTYIKKLVSRKHDIHVISANSNVFQIVDSTLKVNKNIKLKYSGIPYCITENDSSYFVGTINGIKKVNKNNYEGILIKDSLTNIFKANKIQSLLVVKNKEYCLIGAVNGLYRTGPSFKEPFSKLSVIGNQNIITIESDINGTIWIGTANNGIYQLSANDLKIGSKFYLNCLPSNSIRDLVALGKYLFIGTSNGLVRYNKEDGSCKVIGKYEGLKEKSIDKILIKSLDSIFLIQNKSVLMISNDLFDKEFYKPKLFIEDTYVNNQKRFPFTSRKELEYLENNVEINYNFNLYRSTETKAIAYKINQDTTWTVSYEMSIRLPSLGSGDYEVEAKGTYSNDKETDPIVTQFTILPPWWQTTWARVGGLLLLFLLGGGILSYWTRRIKEREESKRKYLEQINQVKDQALQLQMNPHFIFNAMNAIQNFISSDNEESAASYLAKFARLIRMIFEYSKSNLITLEQELEFVMLYIELEKLRFKDKVEVDFIIDDRIEAEKDILNISPLLVQPIIENSFKHGLFHKKGKGLLKVEYTFINHEIKVIVEDNGIGRQAAMAYKTNVNDDQESSGIKNTAERLGILNFNNDTDANRIEIEDLENNSVPSGTRTTIYIKIRENQA